MNYDTSKLSELIRKRNTLAGEALDITRAEHVAHERGGDISDGQRTRLDNLERGLAKLDAEIEAERADFNRAVAEAPADAVETSNESAQADFQIKRNRAANGSDQDRGRSTVDAAFRAGQLPDHAAEAATELIDDGSRGERDLAGRWAAAAGNDAYRGAFAKMLGDPTRGHLLWTPAEADAYRQVAAVDAQFRAMSNTSTGTGLAMVPLTLDPAIMLTGDGSNNPLRQLASVRRTVSNTWQGVTSAGASAEWKTEAAEAADGSPTLASPSIDTFLGDAFVPYSFEIGGDADRFLEELAAILRDSADQLMATAYTTGSGSGEPAGIVTGLAGTSSEINTQGTEALAATDPYDLQNALPARFSANATFQAHIATMNTYRQFETSNGAHEFPELRDNPPYLLGKRFFENSNMDSAINAAATENNYAMIYGDIARAFFIVDRVGTTMEMIPNLLGSNGRPTGQRGALLWFRTGSEVVVPEAARLLDVPTTA